MNKTNIERMIANRLGEVNFEGEDRVCAACEGLLTGLLIAAPLVILTAMVGGWIVCR